MNKSSSSKKRLYEVCFWKRCLHQTILLQLAVHMEPVEEASGKKLLNSCTFHTMILSYWRKRPKAVD